MPIPDEQIVKQTIQGVIDEFIFKSDEISMQSMLAQNERVKITENVFQAESVSVINKFKQHMQQIPHLIHSIELLLIQEQDLQTLEVNILPPHQMRSLQSLLMMFDLSC